MGDKRLAAVGTFAFGTLTQKAVLAALENEAQSRGLVPAAIVFTQRPFYHSERELRAFFAAQRIEPFFFPEGKEELQKILSDIGAEVFRNPVFREAEEITDAAAQEAFQSADFPAVSAICGEPFTMIGTVIHGKALGKTVGMPTANLDCGQGRILPPEGVYATTVRIGEETYRAVTNIGRRPTVDADERMTVEAHILDFHRDIYGAELYLSVDRFLRGVRKFASLQEVEEQVEKDIRAVREEK